MNLPPKLNTNTMMVSTTAAAYALFCTSSCGALNWKNTLRGRVAACVRQLAADRTNHILYREAEDIAHRLMAHRNCLLIATSLLKSTRSILLITTRICGMPSSGNDYHTGSKEHTIHLV